MNDQVTIRLGEAFTRDGLTDDEAVWLASSDGAEYRREIVRTVGKRMNPPKVYRLPCGAIPGKCEICDKRSKASPSVSLL